jgi:hypothetical protein
MVIAISGVCDVSDDSLAGCVMLRFPFLSSSPTSCSRNAQYCLLIRALFSAIVIVIALTILGRTRIEQRGMTKAEPPSMRPNTSYSVFSLITRSIKKVQRLQ